MQLLNAAHTSSEGILITDCPLCAAAGDLPYEDFRDGPASPDFTQIRPPPFRGSYLPLPTAPAPAAPHEQQPLQP
jgi:hypothetical protein